MKTISERLEELLQKNGMLECEEEIRHVTEETDMSEVKEDAGIGTTSDGIRYYKKLVFEYLTKNGYRINPENVELAAKKFQVGSKGVVKSERNEFIVHTEMENMPEEQLSEFIQLKILEAFLEIRNILKTSQLKNYRVDFVRDTSFGGTDVDALVQSLSWHEQRGWALKQMITNELGVNSHSFGVGGYSSGTNSTVDQIVLVYERPVWMTDEVASNLLKKEGRK